MNAWREILARVPEAEQLFLPFAIDVDDLSDYERLCALCSVIPLCREHVIAYKVIAAVGKMASIGTEAQLPSASFLWKNYNHSCGADAEEYENILSDEAEAPYNITVEKYNNNISVDLCDAMSESVRAYSDLVCKVKRGAQGSVVRARLTAERFTAPNRYIAEGVFNRLKKGEKCNNMDINCLYSQILCEIFSDKKCNNKGIMIDAGADVEYAQRLVEYMHRYNMRGRIFLGVNVNTDPDAICKVCLMGDEKGMITPVIFMSKNDSYIMNKQYMDQLARVYPSALVERVWID